MAKVQKITALLCALALAVSSLGGYTDNAKAAGLPVTSDNAPPSRETTERGAAKANAQKLEFGKKAQGRMVTGDDGQSYQITLKSSGQLEVRLEGDAGKLAACLTDQNGKSWSPRRRLANGKQIYQLKKGVYHYKIQIAKNAKIPDAGLNYGVTAIFKSAKAKFEDNNTRGKAARPPQNRSFYGHLAPNSPTEYYKFTLKRVSCLSFLINILDIRPETYEVTLYNKSGIPISRWETGWEEEIDWEDYWDGDWYIDNDAVIYDIGPGLHKVLPAGTYYVGVSIKKGEKGKIPMTAHYGQYRVWTNVSGLGVSLELSQKQAEYTGKKMNLPKPSIREYKEDEIKISRMPGETNEHIAEYLASEMWNMSTNDRVYSIKNIGRYRIGHYEGKMDEIPSHYDAYAIFTVTPVRGKINHINSNRRGQIKISARKNAQSTGYQIEIAQDKKFKKSRRTLKTTNIRKTIKGLSSGKKYYVRIRNYKDVKTYYCSEMAVSESIYGKWSKTKTVVCK